MDDFRAEAETCLRAGGHRLTSARRQVIAVLGGADRALSAYAIRERLAESVAPPDVVTVYRILELLETLDLAHRVHSLGGYVACNRVRQGGCHHPVICDGCGRIDEVEGDDVGPVERRLDARGWRITGHVIEFRGLCPACTALKAASGTGAAAARG